MKVNIKRKQERKVMTKYGEKKKYNIYDGSRWYDVWSNRTTDAWKEGMTVEANVVEREYQGKTYYTLQPIPDIERIEKKLDQILAYITGYAGEETPKTEGLPTSDDVPPPDDIPF